MVVWGDRLEGAGRADTARSAAMEARATVKKLLMVPKPGFELLLIWNHWIGCGIHTKFTRFVNRLVSGVE